MEQYYEQTVARQGSMKTGLIYGLCRLLIVVLMIAAMLFASSIFAGSVGNYADENVFDVNWLSVLGVVLCLLAAGILFVRKDYLRMEFDYILQNNMLEICGVMNRRRRKVLARIDLNLVQRVGIAQGSGYTALAGDKTIHGHKWYAQSCRYYIVYMKENIRHAALLELDDHLAELIRRQLPVGVWRNEKGESTNHASLS